MRKLLFFNVIFWILSGCTNYSPSQIHSTALVLGCYPYGYLPELPTYTLPPNNLTPTADPATMTSTPHPTWAMCTPAPRTPTITPTMRPTATPWSRPTDLPPVQRNTPPVNLSNQAGYDSYPVIAVHPHEGWAAIAWTNWLADYPDEGNVLIKVQDSESTWRPAQGVNPEPISKHAGEVSMTIGTDSRIHITYNGLDDQGRYTYSDDKGKTWSNPEIIPMPSNYHNYSRSQLWLDDQGTLHSLFSASPSYDVYNYLHATRSKNGVWTYENQLTPGESQLYADGLSMRVNGKLRNIAAIGCRRGCQDGAGIAIATQDANGTWNTRRPPINQTKRVNQVIQWVNMFSFTSSSSNQQYVCVTWGQYSKSAVQFSCSTDYGETWGETEIIAYHNETVEIQEATPTPDPNDENDDGTWESLKFRGYHPEGMYLPSSDSILVVWNYFNATDGASSLVYSYRKVTGRVWTPFIDAQIQPVDQPLRLFDTTRRNAGHLPRIAPTREGLVRVTWVEYERDESNEIYYGAFFAPALVTKEK